jgi:hypothetical protein
MHGRYSCGRLPGVVFISSGEYDMSKIRMWLEERQENVGRAGHGEAKLDGPTDESPYDGGFRV